ncbi:hypothetical protein WUBG_03727 [Wuchereria bancrofti]|uniref:Uncharacterized protein n=1 Tax=Wuchereria bancrofti TaxID=6293 RepID=J9F750_WUCBA|nr:hypothetical protein WUBG_03727 [Wuchereria bancrofti]
MVLIEEVVENTEKITDSAVYTKKEKWLKRQKIEKVPSDKVLAILNFVVCRFLVDNHTQIIT